MYPSLPVQATCYVLSDKDAFRDLESLQQVGKGFSLIFVHVTYVQTLYRFITHVFDVRTFQHTEHVTKVNTYHTILNLKNILPIL